MLWVRYAVEAKNTLVFKWLFIFVPGFVKIDYFCLDFVSPEGFDYDFNEVVK